MSAISNSFFYCVENPCCDPTGIFFTISDSVPTFKSFISILSYKSSIIFLKLRNALSISVSNSNSDTELVLKVSHCTWLSTSVL